MIRRVFLGGLATTVLVPTHRVLAKNQTLPKSTRMLASSLLLYDMMSAQTLISNNAQALIRPASLTKLALLEIVFALLSAKQLDLDQAVTFSPLASIQPATKLGIPAAASISLKQAIAALCVHSCNDVATAIAEMISGTETAFAKVLTDRAKVLGMKSTSFGNASGLPNQNNWSTAEDMVILSAGIMLRYPQYNAFLGMPEWIFEDKVYKNTNGLVGSYQGMDFSKTGYIRESGFHVVASAERNNKRLIIACLGKINARERDQQVIMLLDRAFSGESLSLPTESPAAPSSTPDYSHGY